MKWNLSIKRNITSSFGWSAIRTSPSFNTLHAIIRSTPAEIKLTIIVRKDTVPGYIKIKNTLPKPNTTKGVKTPNKYDIK